MKNPAITNNPWSVVLLSRYVRGVSYSPISTKHMVTWSKFEQNPIDTTSLLTAAAKKYL